MAVEISFSKSFFASYLCVPESHIRYVFVHHEGEGTELYVPALSVKGIGEWFFNIECSEFMRLTPGMRLLNAKIVSRSKDVVVMRSETGHAETIRLAGFYRRYMT
ncbi:MAG: hypothetical protein K2K92_05045, partial [Duncaniella sp.]|nr:hypothetical protein [Duncaniella sp.]